MEIEPIGIVDELLAADMFCIACAVARRFQRVGAAQALAYSSAATVALTSQVRNSPPASLSS